AYEHCRRILREELGTDPAPATAAIYEQVLTGHPPAPGDEPLAPPPPAGEVPFLGRRSQLARLAAPPDGCRVRIVFGEPGIGKTRLLEEAAARLAGRRVRSTSCFRLVTPVPYAVLADLAPEVLDDVAESRLGPEAGAVRLAARWVEALGAAPILLVVDDLQWADEPSLAVLGLVLRQRPAQLLVLGAARDTELDPIGSTAQFLQVAAQLGVLESTTLGPLTLEEVAAGGYQPADWERSGGHPLLLAELARGGVEADLAKLVLGRAAATGLEATDLLRAAAILDRPAPLTELARLAELPQPAARTAAQRLAAAGLLAEARGEWRPRHDVIAELVRADLTAAATIAWHGRALTLLEAGSADPAELAHHALAAGAWDACLHHSLAAGDRAFAAYANREAAGHYQRVLRAIDEHGAGQPDPGPLRRPAILGAARALIVQARTEDARALLQQLPAGTGPEEVERLLLVADCGWAEWKPSRAVDPARAALAIAQELGDDELEGRVHAFIANPYGSLGELDRATEHIDAAMAIAERRRQPPPAVVLYRRAIIQHQRGDERGALVTLDLCRQLAMDQHDERTLVFERVVRAWALGALGRYGEALAALDDVASIGRGEEAVVRSRVPNSRASFLFDLGLVEMALDADEESLEITRGQGSSAFLEPQVHTLLNLATDHLHLGDPDRAAACLAEVEQLSVEAEYARFRYMNRLHWVRGLLQLDAGDVDAALGEAKTVEQMAQRYRAPKYEVRAHLLRGVALARRGRTSEADTAVSSLRTGVRVAEPHGLAALAAQGHRQLAELTGSSHHARRADQIRAQIVASVEGPLADHLR
ncbi:MAG: AAA family ATPase, partial [Acidimicrobiales bacterium]